MNSQGEFFFLVDCANSFSFEAVLMGAYRYAVEDYQ